MMTRMFSLGAAVLLMACAGNIVDRLDSVGTDPLDTAYLIEGQSVRLVDGRSERPAAPDSATKTLTAVVGRPAYGDLDGAGGEDAVLLLKHDPGGSGTFYYLAVAIRVGERYQGTNAVLIGDRIVPRGVRIGNRMVVARYTDRPPDEPMGTYPTIAKTMVLVVINGQLREIKPLVASWVTIGHEVRAFQPCHGRDAHWLMGRSPASQEIKAILNRFNLNQSAGARATGSW
jgi:hypothetical protein